MTIYGYLRTSTTNQHLDRDLTAIQDYCDKNGLTVDKIFTDQQTDKNFNRPDYQTLKRMASIVYPCTHCRVREIYTFPVMPRVPRLYLLKTAFVFR
jgi:hypothetical protein